MKLKITRKPTLQREVDAIGYLHRNMYFTFCRILVWSLQLEKRSYKLLATRIYKIWCLSGTSFLVKYLKESFLIVQKFVSKEDMNVSSFPVGIAAGLPTIIPGSLRLQIRRGDLATIRGVLAFLAVFRVLKVPSVLKLQTITDPFKGIDTSLPVLEIGRVFRLFRHRRLELPVQLKLLRLTTAGPNGSSSVLNIRMDMAAWRVSPLRPSLERIIDLLEGPDSPFQKLCQEEFLTTDISSDGKILGKLHVKEEAAGKARVFAITDAITQSVLRPLHQFLFSLLRTNPCDGTFNQGAPLERLLALKREGALDGHRFHSYDLSAATDRLPINLQRDILGYYVGSEIADLWAKLLTDRDWYLDNQPYRYAVGQPMGALSSWAMLAITHHYIVQIAACRVGLPEFTHYAILGDDIVIAHDLVAKAYHSLVTEYLGVEINLQKSLVADDCFEFAKRLVTVTGEVTPPGPKNVLLAIKSISGIPSLLLDIVNKGFRIDEMDVIKYFRHIPSVRRKSALKELQWCVMGPFGFVPTESGLSSSVRLNSSLRSVESRALISRDFNELHWCVEHALDEIAYRTWTTAVEKSHKTLCEFESWLKLRSDLTSSTTLDHYIYSLYKEDFMDLVLSPPQGRDIPATYPTNRLTILLPGWEKGVVEEIKGLIRLQDARLGVPLSDPFAKFSERVVIPFKTNLKTVNFFNLVHSSYKGRALRYG